MRRPQPENVVFEKVSDQLITDEKEKEKAAAGADIHCVFAHTQPGRGCDLRAVRADLKEEKHARLASSGAYTGRSAAQIKCPACGTENPADGLRCQKCGSPLWSPNLPQQPSARARPWLKFILIGGALLMLVLCGLLALTCSAGQMRPRRSLRLYGPRSNP